MGLRMVFLVAILRGSLAFAADPIRSDEAVVSDDRNHFSQRFFLGKQVAVVDINATAFEKAEHKLKVGESGVQKVDGHRVLGTDGGLIKSEESPAWQCPGTAPVTRCRAVLRRLLQHLGHSL